MISFASSKRNRSSLDQQCSSYKNKNNTSKRLLLEFPVTVLNHLKPYVVPFSLPWLVLLGPDAEKGQVVHGIQVTNNAARLEDNRKRDRTSQGCELLAPSP